MGPRAEVDGREYSPATSSRRLRLLYFGVASCWGFVVGVVGLMLVLRSTGETVSPSTTALLGMIPAAAVAVVGAGIISGAYQEAKRRRR